MLKIRQFITTIVLFATALFNFCNGQVENLAIDRLVFVSSTDHAPTQAEFAVDGEILTGWRSRFHVDYERKSAPEITLPQWLVVDLQASCEVSEVKIFCEADINTMEFVRDRRFTKGHEIYSSFPTDFSIQVSDTGAKWKTVKRVTDYTGHWGSFDIPKTTCRYVRIFINGVSSNQPVGINELEILGTCAHKRVETNGWKTKRCKKKPVNHSLEMSSASVVPVMDGWEMVCEEFNDTADGAEISSEKYNSASWYNATVPGSVVATLVDQEVFPDPVSGLNNLQIPDALCRYNWWYRRAFRIPEGFLSEGKRILLEADKINHHADVWFNGKKVGNIDYCFVKGTFDITDYINADGLNVIAIRVSPMELVGVPGDKSREGTGWVNSRIISKSSPTYICSSGWDWMPATRDRAMGILEDVRLRSVGSVRIENPQVLTDMHLPDTTKAFVTINVPVRNASDVAQNVTVSVSFADISISEDVTLKPDETTTVSFTPEKYRKLTLRNPKLWWPNGYGHQNLYKLIVKTHVGKVDFDHYECQFGIRKVTYNLPLFRDRRGADYIERTSARYVRIFMEESTTDRFGLMDFSVYDSKDFNNDLAAWKKTEASSEQEGDPASHLTDVRGVSKWYSVTNKDEWVLVDLEEKKSFDYVIAGWDAFGLASKYKIQVSDDKENWTTVLEQKMETPEQLVVSVNGVRIFCKGGNWGFEELAMRMPRDRMETAIKFHKDAGMNMIRTWMGNFFDADFFELCDQYGILVYSDIWGGMPEDAVRYCEIAKDNIIRFRNHPCIALWCGSNETYPAIYIDTTLKNTIKECDPGRLYISHSADDAVVGGDGVYFWVPPVHYYEMAHGFRTELGLPTFPVYETALNTCGDEIGWPLGDVWYYHDFCNQKSLASYLEQVNTPLGKATSLYDFCRKAQFVNYENLRAMYESCNHNMWNDCSALLLWMTHPTWYSTLWQIYDYDFDVNGAWAGAKKGCEKIHIQASLPDWQVAAVNTTAHPLKNITISATVYDIHGQSYWTKTEKGINVPASDVTKSFQIEFPEDIPALSLIRLRMSDRKGRVLSENIYWKRDKPEDLSILNSESATVSCTDITSTTKEGSTYYHFSLNNTSDTVAAMIRISLRDTTTEERILPVFYTDNFVWILPGESKEITIECNSDDLIGKTPEIRLSGYNTEETTSPIINNN